MNIHMSFRHFTLAAWGLLAAGALISSGAALAQTSGADAGARLDRLVKAAQAEKTMMSYGTAPIAQIGDVYKAFEKKYGISVQSYQVTGSPLTTRFTAEGTSKQMQADVISVSDTSLQEEHPDWFQKLSDESFPGWSDLPAAAKLGSSLSISYQVSAFSVFYNTNKMTEATRPKTWLDLVDPKWKGNGQAVLIDPRASATYRSALNAISKAHPGILERMAALDPRLAEAGVPAAQLLAAGTGAFAFPGYQSNAETLIEKGAPIKAVPLQEPELSRRNWISAVAGPHPNAGRLYVHFMIMDEGMTIYCKVNSTASTIVDPTGKNHGCVPLGANPQFLTEAPISKDDSAVVLKALKLD